MGDARDGGRRSLGADRSAQLRWLAAALVILVVALAATLILTRG